MSGFLAKFRERRAARKALKADRKEHKLDRMAATQQAQGDAFNKSRHTGG